MPWSDSLPQFSLAGTVLTVLLLLFAAVGEPFLGRRAFSWLSRRRGSDGRALTRVYAITVGVHVLWGLAVVGVLLLSPNLDAADLGLRSPHAWGPVVGGAVGGLMALAVLWVLVNGLPKNLPLPVGGSGRGGRGRRSAGSRGRGELLGSSEQAMREDSPEDGADGARAPGRRGRRAAPVPLTLPEPERERGLLAPHTTIERALAAGAAVTGGVFGELLYRGLFIVLVAGMGVPLWIAAVLSVALFSVAHLYQGWWGLVSAGASGTLFTVLYLGTGSIWVPILVHVALNLRSLAFPPAEVREAVQRGDDGYEEEYGDEYDDAVYDDAVYDDEYEDPGHERSHQYEEFDRGSGSVTGPASGDDRGGGDMTSVYPPITTAFQQGAPESRDGVSGAGAVGSTPPYGTPAHGAPAYGAAAGPPTDTRDAALGGHPDRNMEPGHEWARRSAPVEGSPPGTHMPHVGAPGRDDAWNPSPGLSPGHGAFGHEPSHDVSAQVGPSFPETSYRDMGHDGPLERPHVHDRALPPGDGLGPRPSHGAPSWGVPPSDRPTRAAAPGPEYGTPDRPAQGGAPSHGPSSGDVLGDPGDVLGNTGESPRSEERGLYPDEWIDRRYGEGDHTSGSGSDSWR